MSIIYSNYISTKNIIHTEFENSIDALKHLVLTNADGVSFTKTKNLSINIDQCDTTINNEYFYELPILLECDVIDNIEFIVDDAHLSELYICIGDDIIHKYESIEELLLALSSFTKLKFKIIFNTLADDDKNITLQIKYRCYLLSNDIRFYLRENTIETPTEIYTCGCIYPLKNS